MGKENTPLNLRVRILLRQEFPHLSQSCTFFSVYVLAGGQAEELVGEGGGNAGLGSCQSSLWCSPFSKL